MENFPTFDLNMDPSRWLVKDTLATKVEDEDGEGLYLGSNKVEQKIHLVMHMAYGARMIQMRKSIFFYNQ